jgi:hypothetical protein
MEKCKHHWFYNKSSWNIKPKAALVDGAKTTGKITLSQGRHVIEVHKDNWKYVDVSTVSNLDTLKSADDLYPYNHRYIVEGFDYPADYPSTEEKIYRGFDTVAEYLMKEVSVFDMNNNVKADDYGKFAVGLDVEDPSRTIDGSAATTEEQAPNKVFVLKVNENNTDFVNEQFVLRFKSANSLFKYLRLKAVLKTTNTAITPTLDSYRIKISS